jgi:two-component system sensor histidine kinase HydH
MTANGLNKKGWFGVPPWIILGSVIILLPIFVFWALDHINKYKENTTFLLLEKGAALIRSFEAGTRTGMMGMMGMRGGGFQLQRLLMETAQQPDIAYLIVTNINGTILAHNDPSKIGRIHGRELDLKQIFRSKKVEWRRISNLDGAGTFEVFRRFLPTQELFRKRHGRMIFDLFRQPHINPSISQAGMEYIIFVGLDMGPIETARKEDTRHTIIMAFILLLIGFAGIFFLFLAHAYHSARTTLTRVKAFSDNVVENMPIGLLAIDEYGKIVSFNHTAELVLKLISREVLGKKAGEILPREIDALTAQLKAEKKVIEKEIDCPLKDGKSIPMDVSVSLLEGDNGTFLGHIILFRDLTEIQELKREIERSQRLASLGKLAAGIAHEIRNPLSSIKGFATFFNERFKDMPEYQSTAKIMIQEVDRLNRVITQLLEFARPLEVIKKPVSIRPLIQLSLKIIEREAQSKNIRITTKFSPEINEVHIDQDRFNQVLLNLYLNAVEAMEDGGVLSVALSREDDTQKVRITVSDTGAGIKKEDMVHIFDPYFTTKQSGTGLGLAIVHKIIESHKGEVKIESEFGKGTTVTITLPQY